MDQPQAEAVHRPATPRAVTPKAPPVPAAPPVVDEVPPAPAAPPAVAELKKTVSAVPPAAPRSPEPRIDLSVDNIDEPAPPVEEIQEIPVIDDAEIDAPEEGEGGRNRLVWMAALVVAGVLLLGGAFKALSATGQQGGAESPEAAMTAMLAALGNEDFIAVAELMDPAERRTLAQPGFDMVDELIRLRVLREDLNKAGMQGIDFTFTEPEAIVTTGSDSVALMYLEGGASTTSIDGSQLPFGTLITDRISPEELSMTESTSMSLESEVPVAAVRRDGRWYLSLWHTVGENLFGTRNASTPPALMAPVGSESPEIAVESMIRSISELDIEAAFSRIDPEEGAAMYHYSGVFLPELRESIDVERNNLRADGYAWQITDLQTSAEISGDDADVSIDRLAFDVNWPDGNVTVAISPEGATAEGLVQGESFAFTGTQADNGCLDVVMTQGGEMQSDQVCPTTDGGDATGLTSVSQAGAVAAHRVDGQWFVSPTTTVTDGLLGVLRSMTPEQLEALVDTGDTGLLSPWGLNDLVASGVSTGSVITLNEPESYEPESFQPMDIQPGSSEVTLTAETAPGLPFNATLELVSGQKHDVTLASLGAGESITATLRSVDGSGDAFLTVIGPTGAAIAMNDDATGLDVVTTDARVDFVVPSDGVYSVRAEELWGEAAVFELSIN